MLEMVERRKIIWNNIPKTNIIENEEPDYRLMNIFKLKEIAKSRNILTCKLKKAEIVNLL